MVMLRQPVRRGQAESRACLPTPTCSGAPACSPQHRGCADYSPDSKGQRDGWKIPSSQEIWPFYREAVGGTGDQGLVVMLLPWHPCPVAGGCGEGHFPAGHGTRCCVKL